MISIEKSRLEEKVNQGVAISECIVDLAQAIGKSEDWAKGVIARTAGPADKFRKLQSRLNSDGGLIAIIGAEKAGKSTFLNAWLGKVILPTNYTRCTLATAEIKNSDPDVPASMVVEWRNQEQFKELVSQLETAGDGAAADRKEIDKYNKKLLDLVGKSSSNKIFADGEDLRDEVSKVVANPEAAYAVNRARINMHIPTLSLGTVICDAPGIDSGLKLHQDLLSDILNNCDAVVFVKSIKDPDPKSSEQMLIERIKNGASAQGLNFVDRLFVFLNHIDQELKDQAQARLVLARQQWAKLGVPGSQIFAGSARAALLESCSSGDKAFLMKSLSMNEEEILETISKTNALQGALKLKDFASFKNEVNNFIDTGRHLKAERDTLISIQEVKKIAVEVLSKFEDNYGVSAGSQATSDTIWQRKFNKWINRYINRTISSEINAVFGEGSAEIESLSKQPIEYIDGVREAIQSLPSLQELDKIFDRYRTPLQQPENANASARESLHAEIERAMLNRGETIAYKLFDLISRLKETVNDLSWGDTGLMDQLTGEDKVYRAGLKEAINALLMRYARPVNEAFIYASRNTTPRIESQEKWKHELKTVELFMSEINYSQNSEKNINSISSVKSNEQKSAPDFGILATVNKSKEAQENVFKSKEAVKKQEHGVFAKVEEEINEDVNKVRSMLETGVYLASGVQQYCDQEFRRVRQGITSEENKHFWQAAAISAYNAKNPVMMNTLSTSIGSSDDGSGERDLKFYQKLKMNINIDNR